MNNTTSSQTHLDIRDLHEQLVQPITYLNAAIELWEMGLHLPEDMERMKEEIHRLVEVVRDMQSQMRTQKLTLVTTAA